MTDVPALSALTLGGDAVRVCVWLDHLMIQIDRVFERYLRPRVQL